MDLCAFGIYYLLAIFLFDTGFSAQILSNVLIALKFHVSAVWLPLQ